MIAGTTTRTRVQPCSVCGVEMEHRENIGYRADLPSWWSPSRHNAPCGAPCMGGGVRPLRAEERPPGVSGIAHAHRAKECGTPGCEGGTHPVSVDLTCYSCGDSAINATDALARHWTHVSGRLWICEPCDLAPRCRMCDAIATDATGRLCEACDTVRPS